jgi:capsular polysaccharide biosynthesis protein
LAVIRYNRFVLERRSFMELIALVNMLKRRWWLILLPAVVALLVTLPSLKNVISPPVTYAVQVRLTAAAPPEVDAEGVTTPYEDSVYVPLLASEYVVVNLPHWITSDSFADEVSAVLAEQGLDIKADDLVFNADSFRSILTLYAYWDDPDELRAISEAAITILQTRNQAYFPQFAAEPLTVKPLDEPTVNEVAPPFTTRLMPLARIVIGLIAGLGLAVLAEYLDSSLRNRTEVEALGLPVLAEIPRE